MFSKKRGHSTFLWHNVNQVEMNKEKVECPTFLGVAAVGEGI